MTSDQHESEALHQSESSSPSTSSTPLVSTSSTWDSPTSPIDCPVQPRRRTGGRSRPRPISDYGQLSSHKHNIPEDLLVNKTSNILPKDMNSRKGLDLADSTEDCSVNSDTHSLRQRPISVIGDMFDAEEKGDHSQSVSFPLSQHM